MKAIFISAGEGSRLGNITKDLPKSLVDVNGKSILERQIETFRNNGIKEIIVIIGPNKDKFQLKNIEYVVDKKFHDHEQLGSLMAANKHFQNDVVISFGDVIVDNNIMKQVIESTYDIGVAIDLNWEKKYENRTQHPKSEADLALIKSNKLIKIKKNLNPTENHQLGEFLGIIKLNNVGSKKFLNIFERLNSSHQGEFHNAPSLQKAYLTDMIDELIQVNEVVNPIFVDGVWFEIDTIEDLENIREKIVD
ncbi:NTP transferase domain-containing protein [Marine Group I thaumarchaeote]|jgi:phosphoenolpyruvate phosphomutase|uniref:NTP transferase domain-containing protein n=1 Tax=Marine Group I thaumarchaeote TaxID=2511932 RepID=A0A7K4NRF7_9ARCH|nr:NTP transferase domain-containing protein [Marine Group I thaumarchaeote]